MIPARLISLQRHFPGTYFLKFKTIHIQERYFMILPSALCFGARDQGYSSSSSSDE